MMTANINVSPDLVFNLSNSLVSYIFLAVPKSGDLLHLHFGSPTTSSTPPRQDGPGGWSAAPGRLPREFPDLGHGDFRLPAIRISHDGGSAVTAFKYADHEVVDGKPDLDGLPSTFAGKGDAKTVVVHMKDEVAGLDAYLSYTIFATSPTIARSHRIVNTGNAEVIIEQASVSVDMPNNDWEMIQLSGNWGYEANPIRRKVYLGVQGIHSSTGYSSHLHNPFLGLVTSSTTETTGEAYGFSMIYTGSFAAHVERETNGLTRTMIGLNPLHLSWPLCSGQSFTAPEVVAVYSPKGLGGMSRAFHNLFRHHLSRSPFTLRPRPALLNNWEGTYFDFDGDTLYDIAKEAAGLGVKLFVMDDGWFGDKHPRVNEKAGLGDWVVNPKRFPNGLSELVDKVRKLEPRASQREAGAKGDGMIFGIWVEPEMVNPESELYEAHPEWILYSEGYRRSERRNQLVLDLSLKPVQDYIIEVISNLLKSADIGYVKWDNNRGMHEMTHPSKAHGYILGLYRVLSQLTTSFPSVLWEGCASGGGRFDPGILHYWPQSWTSDNTDGLDRLSIQFGTSLIYPPSSMAGHVSAIPSHQTGRSTPLTFRAHVAMMCGSFGFELDPRRFTPEEKEIIPGLIELSERINPLVIHGELYRLAGPVDSNWPVAQFVSADAGTSVVLAFQMQSRLLELAPAIRLEGLDKGKRYRVTGTGKRLVDGVGRDGEVEGSTLVADGIRLDWQGDYQSRVIWVEVV